MYKFSVYNYYTKHAMSRVFKLFLKVGCKILRHPLSISQILTAVLLNRSMWRGGERMTFVTEQDYKLWDKCYLNIKSKVVPFNICVKLGGDQEDPLLSKSCISMLMWVPWAWVMHWQGVFNECPRNNDLMIQFLVRQIDHTSPMPCSYWSVLISSVIWFSIY